MKQTNTFHLRLLLFVLLLLLLHFIWMEISLQLNDTQNLPLALHVRCIAMGLLILASSCLLFKSTTWIGTMITANLVFLRFWFYLFHDTFTSLDTKNINQFLNAVIWCLSLFILWNERKNIPFIN